MIPVYLVTGALGSGKTSFLRQILAKPLLYGQSAVIVNDFGDLMFDQLAQSGNDGEIIELPGGCICCSAADEFRGVVRKVLERKPERLFVEASGIAETRPFRDDLYLMGLTAQATICIVDCANYNSMRIGLASIDEQIDAADILLLSKSDIAGAAALAELQSELQLRKPQTIQYLVRKGYLEADALQVLFGTRSDFLPGGDKHPRLFEHDVLSFVITLERSPKAEKLSEFLECLPGTIVRLKGLVHVRGDAPGFIRESSEETTAFHINSVCGRWEAIEQPDEEQETEMAGELLLIYLPMPGAEISTELTEADISASNVTGAFDSGQTIEKSLKRCLQRLPGARIQSGILQRLREDADDQLHD